MTRRFSKTALWIVILCFVLSIAGGISAFAYLQDQQKKRDLLNPEGTFVTCDVNDLAAAGPLWLRSFLDQCGVGADQYTLDASCVLEDGENQIIRLDFTLLPEGRRLPQCLTTAPNAPEGALSSDSALVSSTSEPAISSASSGQPADSPFLLIQWVLWFKTESMENNQTRFEVTQYSTPAGYELFYQDSGQKSKDDDENAKRLEAAEFQEKQKDQPCRLDLRGDACFVTFDGGQTHKEVPLSVKRLTWPQNESLLEEGSYCVTREKTAFVFQEQASDGEASRIKLLYTDDRGKTWSTSVVADEILWPFALFCSFPTASDGYVFVSYDKAMSFAAFAIFKTTDGGQTWREVGEGPSTRIIKACGFITPDIGFLCNSREIYRTEDGGESYTKVEFPAPSNWDYFINFGEVFIAPQLPTQEGDHLTMLVGQGEDGDYQGGRIMARYESSDFGRSWRFIGFDEPPSVSAG